MEAPCFASQRHCPEKQNVRGTLPKESMIVFSDHHFVDETVDDFRNRILRLLIMSGCIVALSVFFRSGFAVFGLS